MDEQMLQQMQMQGQPQQSPDAQFKPMSMPSVGDLLQAYRQHNQALLAQTQSQTQTQVSGSEIPHNPWESDQIDPNQLQQEEVAHKAWLSKQPVAATYTPQFDEDTHNHIMNNLDRDPAYQEIKKPFMGILQTLHGYIQDGTLTKDQAMQHLAEAAPMIEETLERHHGKHSVSHKQSLTVDPDLHNMPVIQQKTMATKRGGK